MYINVTSINIYIVHVVQKNKVSELFWKPL